MRLPGRPGRGALNRRVVAMSFGAGVTLVSAIYAYISVSRRGYADFIWPWRGAQILLAGGDPYAAMGPHAAAPFTTAFYYPLTAAVSAAPFSFLSLATASALFVAVSSALLTWAIVRSRGAHRLAMLASVSYWAAISQGQWTPLLIAAALLPGLGWLLAAKPHIGGALFAAWPRRGTIIAGTLFIALTLLIDPRWPLKWIGVISHSPYHRSPVLSLPLGPLLLLAGLRWRQPEGRLLLALACVPQYAGFYDTLPLFLVTRTARQSWLLVAFGWATLLATGVVGDRELCMQLGLYFPALVCLLSSPRPEKSTPEHGVVTADSAA